MFVVHTPLHVILGIKVASIQFDVLERVVFVYSCAFSKVLFQVPYVILRISPYPIGVLVDYLHDYLLWSFLYAEDMNVLGVYL